MNNEFESPLSQSNLDKAIAQELDDIEKEVTTIGVITKDGDVGVEATVSKSIGKGWGVTAEGSWMRRTKASIAAMLTWKGKSE